MFLRQCSFSSTITFRTNRSLRRLTLALSHICNRMDNYSIVACLSIRQIYQVDKNDSMFDVLDCCRYLVDIVQVPYLFVDTYVLWDRHSNLVHLDQVRLCRFHMVYIQLHHQDYMYQVDTFRLPILLRPENRLSV